MKFNVELKRVVDDSYDIEISGALQDKCVGDIENGLFGSVRRIAVVTKLIPYSIFINWKAG